MACSEGDARDRTTSPPIDRQEDKPADVAALPTAAQGDREMTSAHEPAPSKSSDADIVSSASKALPVAFVVPRLAAAGVMSSRSMLAEAVYFATGQTGSAALGQITRTGTVTVTQAGAVYAASPKDKLVVKVGTQVNEFESIEAAGDNSAATATAWLMAPHRLSYKHRIPDQAEGTISEQFDGSRFEARVTGWAALAGRRYDVDLVARGSTQGQSDFDGRESETRYEVTGTIRGHDVEISVHEQDASSFASTNSVALLYSQRGWADQSRCTLASTAKCGGDVFRFENVQVESGAKEKGGQSSSGVVATSGRILRNDTPFAECTLQNGSPVAVAGGSVIPLTGAAK
jgi:hypothetical protein